MLPKISQYRFDPSDLWAYKGPPKPKKQKVIATQSAFGGMNNATMDSPFGSGSSTYDKATGTLKTSSSLSPELQNSANLAQSGLSSNLTYLGRNPQEQVAQATGGNDPYYNVLSEQANQAFDNNLGRLRLNAFKGGGLNSTAAGAAYGNLGYQKNLYDNQILMNALNFGNQQATQNANTNLGAIGGLANLVNPLATVANNNLLTGMQDQSRASAATVAAQNEAEKNYNAAMNQYRLNQYNNSLMSGLSTLSPALGFATGHNQQAIQGLALNGQIIGAVAGMAKGAPTPTPNVGAQWQPPTYSVLSDQGFKNAMPSNPFSSPFNTSMTIV